MANKGHTMTEQALKIVCIGAGSAVFGLTETQDRAVLAIVDKSTKGRVDPRSMK